MVTVSSLEKISAVGKLPDYLAVSEPSGGKDQKLDIGPEDGGFGFGVHRAVSRSMNQNKTMRSDLYVDSTCYRADNSHLVGVVGAQNESTLFSSSLSDLVHHKLRLSSNKVTPRQSSSIVPQNGEVDSFESPNGIDGHAINNILPDEDDLFSGIADEMGHMSSHANIVDDLDDFDLFIGSGGIELEDDAQAGQRNFGHHPWALYENQKRSAQQPLDSSRGFNGYASPARMPSEFGHLEASQAFARVQLDSRGIQNFHPHSPHVSLHNVIPQRTLDGFSGMPDDNHLKVPEKVSLDMRDMRHLGLNGHGIEKNDGGFGYSTNGIHIPESMASKSNSYQHHQLRSLLIPNSPSFLNNNQAHHIGRLSGSPVAPHLMMNIASPVHQLHVGSAPVMKASLWDRQQMYTAESQMGSVRSMGIPGFSPSHPREITSFGSLSHASEVSKNTALHSPQQMSHMFHERNSLNSLPTSFGSPSERVRSRRSDNNLSHSDRKHYELNLERILRGDDCRTTLMIKNIPNKYTSKMLLATIDEHHRGKYDFVYLPIDFKNKCNMGYAFINMIDPIQIVGFHQTFEGRKWEKFNSEKVATLAYARIQGKGALIAHFQNSSLMNEDKRCRPILFHTEGPNAGDQEPFPMGSHFRTKSGRQQVSGSEDDE